MVKITALTLFLVLAAAPAFAQSAGPSAMPDMSTGAAEGSMMASMDKMTKAMAAVPMTGNADRDFVAMMMPHHQGAIDMARFELAHGKDPAMRRLAREIIAAQQKELTQMQRWQAGSAPRQQPAATR